jgi:hypothetical protein
MASDSMVKQYDSERISGGNGLVRCSDRHYDVYNREQRSAGFKP